MENSPSSDLHPPIRSISLPTRIHSISVKLESAINHLKTWQISTPVLGAEMLQNGFVGLAEMYNCIEEFINSSTQTQQALLHYENGQLVEEALDKSVTLIDTCSSTRDMLLLMKENVQALQSALRRRGSRDYSSLENEIASYITFRKKMKRDISKSLQALTKLESKNKTLLGNVDYDQHLSFTIKVLGEASALTIFIFRSLLMFVSMPAANKTKLGGWSLISKLMKMRLLSSSLSHDDQKMINQVASVDFAVYSLHGSSRSSSTCSNSDKASEVTMTQKKLQGLCVSIEGLEIGVDSMFKCLVQNRISFLNILTN